MRSSTVSIVMTAVVGAFGLGLVLGGSVTAQQKFPTTKTVFSQEFADIEGYKADIIEVGLEPGAGIGGHRHSGHMFVYVLEGRIVSQLEDGEKIEYGPGDIWYEHPMMLHADFHNPSESEAARAVIFSVVQEGKPQTILEPHNH